MRIFDTFLFGGELTLLEHRLHETWDRVDQFVLVEAAQTFRGDLKALLFRDNRDRFAWAMSKIRLVSLERLGAVDASPWQREALQRDAILLGLGDAAPDDVVLILDADEIPSASLLERLRRDGIDRPHRLAMTRHYQHLDWLAPASSCCPPSDAAFPFSSRRRRPGEWEALDRTWFETTGIAARFRDLRGDPEAGLPARSPYELRRGAHEAPVLRDAGRHLVSVEPGIAMGPRLARLSHAELAGARAIDACHLERARRNGIHHHGWWYAERPAGALPEDLARLAGRCPQALGGAMPELPSRRLARTWAWLRHWPMLGERVTAMIDRHFGVLLPVLAAPLAFAGLARHMAVWGDWKWFGKFSADLGDHGHG